MHVDKNKTQACTVGFYQISPTVDFVLTMVLKSIYFSYYSPPVSSDHSGYFSSELSLINKPADPQHPGCFSHYCVLTIATCVCENNPGISSS